MERKTRIRWEGGGGCRGELSGEPASAARAPKRTVKMRSSQGTKRVGSVRAGARVTVTQRCAEWSGRNTIKSVTL